MSKQKGTLNLMTKLRRSEPAKPGSLERVVRATWVEMSEAYSEAACHLDACAAEESNQLQKEAYNLVSEKLYVEAKVLAQRGGSNDKLSD
jgi:hypothetical protein